MSNKQRLYVEGQSRALDDLAKTYEKIENVPAWSERPKTDAERPAGDPFGMASAGKKKKAAATVDRFADGKEAAMRITKFIALCASEMGLEPEQTIFAVELAALNTLNAQDCPVAAGEIEKIRNEAFRYYEQALPKIPDAKS